MFCPPASTTPFLPLCNLESCTTVASQGRHPRHSPEHWESVCHNFWPSASPGTSMSLTNVGSHACSSLSTHNPRLPSTPALARWWPRESSGRPHLQMRLGHGEWETKTPQEKSVEQGWVNPRLKTCRTHCWGVPLGDYARGNTICLKTSEDFAGRLATRSM